MISKKEIMERICAIEFKCDELALSINKFDNRIKKLEPKKEKKDETTK